MKRNSRDFKPMKLPGDGLHRGVCVLLILVLLGTMLALALSGCAGGGWECSVRPVRIDREMAVPTMARDEKAVPGMEVRCVQR